MNRLKEFANKLLTITSRIEFWIGLFIPILLIVFLIIIYLYLGNAGLEFASIYISGILSILLIVLYYKQTEIAEDQTEIMEFNRRVKEAELSPDVRPYDWDINNSEFECILENHGEGVAIDIQSLVSREISGEEFQCESRPILPDGDILTSIRRDEEYHVRIPLKVPIVNDGEVKCLDLDEQAVQNLENGRINIRLKYDNAAGSLGSVQQPIIFDGDINDL